MYRRASHQAANVREREIDFGKDYESDRRFGSSWLVPLLVKD